MCIMHLLQSNNAVVYGTFVCGCDICILACVAIAFFFVIDTVVKLRFTYLSDTWGGFGDVFILCIFCFRLLLSAYILMEIINDLLIKYFLFMQSYKNYSIVKF